MSEEILVRQGAPTLAGIKTGSLFPCPCEDHEALMTDIRRLNRRLSPKGLCLLPLRFLPGQALLYLYRPAGLRRDLRDVQASELLRQAGYEISPDPDGAELVIVNTCGFIESAKTEAIDNILAMAQLKAEGRIQKILVTGCLAQRYQEEILKELPEVDGVLGTGSYYDVANAVGQVLSGKRYKRFDDINADQSEDGRILTTPEYYAYLKIAEGCDNHCAYCVIPKLL